MLYTNVATNTLSTTWLTRSRRKVRRIRGENWVDDSCSATSVSPSTRAITVIIVPEMPISRTRASSAVPWNTRGSSGEPSGTVTELSTDPVTSASSTASVGYTHRAPLR